MPFDRSTLMLLNRYLDTWASSVYYALGEYVVYQNAIYKAVESHTSSSTFAADVDKWMVVLTGEATTNADHVAYDNTVSKLVSTNIQSAITELSVTSSIFRQKSLDVDVVNGDVVTLKDGVWVPLDGTVEFEENMSWGIAINVNTETHVGDILYNGKLINALVTSPGNWYCDAFGKLTQTVTNFYVGYAFSEGVLYLDLINSVPAQ